MDFEMEKVLVTEISLSFSFGGHMLVLLYCTHMQGKASYAQAESCTLVLSLTINHACAHHDKSSGNSRC